MFFIIQKDKIETDPVQDAIILDLLHRYRYEHKYEFMSFEDFYKDEDIPFSSQRIRKCSDDFDDKYQQAIPIGSINFVRTWLQIFKGIQNENAIEVPPILRTDRFLRRICQRPCRRAEGDHRTPGVLRKMLSLSSREI